MNAREVLHAASGLLLVLAGGDFFVTLILVAAGLPNHPIDTLPGVATRLLMTVLFVSSVALGFAGLLAAIFGKEAKG